MRQNAWILFHLLRPTFYSLNTNFARASDLLSLILNAFLLRPHIPRSAFVIATALSLFLLVQIISVNIQGFETILVTSDLIPLIYPLIALVAFFAGTQVSELNKYFNMIQRVLLAGAILAILQKFTGTVGIYLSELYNTPALTVVGRFGGFSYTHTEHAAFCALGLALTLRKKNELTTSYKLLSICLFSFSVLIPLSKAGVILYCLVIFFAVSNYMKVLLVVLSSIIIIGLPDYLSKEWPYIYHGFGALVSLDLTNGSVGPRYEDWIIALDSLSNSLTDFLVGGGPRRFYEESYIEITAANILFRWGLIGAALYYLPLFYTFVKTRKAEPLMCSFLLSVLLVDLTANFTESVKLFPILYFLFGALLKDRSILRGYS